MDTCLRVAAVWKELPAGVSFEEARDYLCPIIAHTEAEQKKFRETFQRHSALLGIYPDDVAEKAEEQAEATEAEKKPPNRRVYILATALAAAGMALAVLWLYPRLNPVEGPKELIAPPQVITPDTLAIPAVDTLAAESEPPATPRPTLSGLAQRDSVSYRPRFEDKPVSLPALQPIRQDAWFWIAEYKNLASWILYVLLLAPALGIYFWRRAKKQYIARRERGDEPPYRLPIKVSRGHSIALEPEFFLALNRLRGREAGERRRMDIPGTIAATIRQGGAADIRFQALSRPVEYLILIDKNTEQNHQSQLFEYLYRHFVRQEVYAERFFFDAEPMLCWNDRYPGGLPLQRLFHLYRNARLLVLSDGHSFIDP
ncbi:MAG: hypothetical protein KDD10_30015, partial [Phaeodactylibacter sp.]|nr:hypothetical protein [Phaeodactylibacter sp.]